MDSLISWTYGDPERGRRLIEASGHCQDGMVDSGDVLAALHAERHEVEFRGYCSTTCENTEQIEHYATGKIVCPRTLQPCPGRRLCKLLDLFGKVNS